MYGNVSADEYLGKFVHLFFSLPERNVHNTNSVFSEYVGTILERYKLSSNYTVEEVRSSLVACITPLRLNLRDIEKCVALFAMADDDREVGLLMWLIVLKVKRSDMYQGVLRGDRDSRLSATKLAMQINKKYGMELVAFHHQLSSEDIPKELESYVIRDPEAVLAHIVG